MELTFDNINIAYKTLCQILVGAQKTKDTHEILGSTLILTDPRSRIITLPVRDISMRYLIGELCFYLSGSHRVKQIAHYSKFWNKLADEADNVNSAYGYEIFHREQTTSHSTQYDYCLDCLTRDPDTRKAVITLYDANRHSIESPDNPCTMSLQFLLRSDYLSMITYMRSNDIWYGFTYDIPFFTFVQEMMLIELRHRLQRPLKLGRYVHHVGSLHVYDKHFDRVNEIAITPIERARFYDTSMPNLMQNDISSWFHWLLKTEQRLRIAIPMAHDDDEKITPFQTWAIDILLGRE